MTLIQPMRRGLLTPAPFSLTETDTDSSLSDLTTYNFAGISLGDDVEGSDVRYTVVVIGTFQTGARTLSSATIAGASASVVSDGVTPAEVNNQPNAIIIIADTSGLGATGTISITMSDSMRGMGIAVYRLINPASAQANDVATDDVDVSGLLDLSVDIPAGGAAVAGVNWQNGGTSTWTGLTESIDVDLETDDHFTAAFGGAAGSPHSVTCQALETSPFQQSGVAASWGP